MLEKSHTYERIKSNEWRKYEEKTKTSKSIISGVKNNNRLDAHWLKES